MASCFNCRQPLGQRSTGLSQQSNMVITNEAWINAAFNGKMTSVKIDYDATHIRLAEDGQLVEPFRMKNNRLARSEWHSDHGHHIPCLLKSYYGIRRRIAK